MSRAKVCRYLLVAAATVWFSSSSNAETVATDVAAPQPAESKVIGGVDIRPSWASKAGNVYSENFVELGYQFNPNTKLTFVHDFNNDLVSPQGSPDDGINLTAVDAFVRTRLNNIYTIPSTNMNLSYESRIYLPITQFDRDNGAVTTLRNYFKLRMPVTERVAFTVMELPIFHLFNRTGTIAADGSSNANYFFENRVYAIADFTITDRLSLSVPLMFHFKRFNDFAGAANSGKWQYILWTYPELSFSVNPNLTLGLAYYSDNLIKSDLSNFDLGNGFEKGVFQISVAANL